MYHRRHITHSHPGAVYAGVPEIVEETQVLIDEGGRVVDEATTVARQSVPLSGRPQATMMITAAAAGLVGAIAERPLTGAILGAVVGWLGHKTWMKGHDASPAPLSGLGIEELWVVGRHSGSRPKLVQRRARPLSPAAMRAKGLWG